jgi:hypothetical protein
MGLGDPDLWVAGQFDRPYLLTETGSAVASVLGRLTNVTLIYAAVRECNRRASERRRRHADRSSELDSVRSQMGAYATLPTRLAAGRKAEAGVEWVQELFNRRVRLAELRRAADDAESRSVQARATVHPVPSTERLGELAGRRGRLAERLLEAAQAQRRLASVTATVRRVPDVENIVPMVTLRANLSEALDTLIVLEERRSRLAVEAEQASTAAATAKTQFQEALDSAGSCPLCGASSASAQIARVV